MKKQIIPAALLALLAGASGARAIESADVQVNVSGTVPARCVLTGTPVVSLDFQNNLTKADGTVNSGFRNNGSTGTIIGHVQCNAPSNLSIRSEKGALKTGSAPYTCLFTPASDTCIRYMAIVEWDGTNAAVSADGSAAGLVSPDRFIDHPDNTDLVLKVTLQGGGGGVVALGDYSDTLTIRVGADL